MPYKLAFSADFGLNRDEFRRFGKDTIDYIADYHETIQKRRVVPAIEPGYLRVGVHSNFFIQKLKRNFLHVKTVKIQINRVIEWQFFWTFCFFQLFFCHVLLNVTVYYSEKIECLLFATKLETNVLKNRSFGCCPIA